jgi:hypothetical protein
MSECRHAGLEAEHVKQRQFFWSCVILVATLGFFAGIRLPLLNLPLERDEGEYAYAGQMILRGINPYLFCYTMKLPGTAAAYAFFMAILGQTAAAIHFGLLLVNSTTTVVVYCLGRRLLGPLEGAAAAASFALLSLDPSVLGMAAHATQFVLLPAMCGIWVLLRASESEAIASFFISGFLFGLAFLMKQPGILFSLFALFYLVQRQRDWRRVMLRTGAMLAGQALPFAATCVTMLKGGAFGRFWLWTIDYARQYGSSVPLLAGPVYFARAFSDIVLSAPLIWLLALAGVKAVTWEPIRHTTAVFLRSFLLFSFMAVCPGLYFRPHYFVLLLPAVALLCAAAISASRAKLMSSIRTRSWASAPIFFFLIGLAFSVGRRATLFFEQGPATISHSIYGNNAFVETREIADYIRTHTESTDRIAVLGSEPEIYFYSSRSSATGYVYMNPLMEAQPYAHAMQKEMIAEIEASHPKYLVYVNTPGSWSRRPDSDTTLFSWLDTYTKREYRVAGVIDILSKGTEYHWDDAQSYQAHSPRNIIVFKIKPSADL